MGSGKTWGGIKSPLLALALSGAVVSSADAAPTLKGRVLGADDGTSVWLGVVGPDREEADWSLVEGGHFETPVLTERASLVVMAKDRVPLTISVPPETQSQVLELHLTRGLALVGTVRTKKGRPLGGAEIRVAPANTVASEMRGREGFTISLRDAKTEIAPIDGHAVEVPAFARPTWETDRDGVFRVDGLKSARYVLEASAEGFVPVVLRNIAIREGTVHRLELELLEAFFVAGKVIDRDGTPVAGAEVRAIWHQPAAKRVGDSHEPVDRPVRRRTTGRTGDDGMFRLGPFEAGPQLTVFATSTEFGSSRRHEALAPYDGIVLQLRRRVVRGRVVDAITGEALNSFQLSLHRNGVMQPTLHAQRYFEVPVEPDTNSLHIEAPGLLPWFTRLFTNAGGEYDLGKIALERERSITGVVRNARSGEPISGARVRRSWRHHEDALLRVFTRNRFGSRFARTGADGEFELDGLPRHADRLEVVVEGKSIPRLVDLPRDVTRIEIELAVDAAIAGSLVFSDGAPAKGTARVWDWTGHPWQADVAEDGAFRWEGLADGEYRVTATSDAGAVASRRVVLRDGESVEGLRLVVEPGGRLSGTITGLRRGEQATVAVQDPNGRAVLKRDFDNGTFSLRGVPDEATVAARTTLSRVMGRAIRLDDSRTARVDLDFSGDARLEGTVTAGGRPVGDVRIAVVPDNRSRPTAYTTTSELGRYAVQGISDGRHSVQTRTGHSFAVNVAQNATLDIELPAISLSGSVWADRTGRPVAGGWVRLAQLDASADSPVVLGTPIASDGHFRFDGLAQGDYVIRISHRNFVDASRRLHIMRPEVVEFRLERTAAETTAE